MTNRVLSKSQVILTGVYRVGSEFLSLLLGSHPLVSSTMYRINVPRFVVGKYGDISLEENYRKALSDVNDRTKERYQMNIPIEKILNHLDKLETVSYGDLYDSIMYFLYLENTSKEVWIEKNQLHWRDLKAHLNYFPGTGKGIILIRDPRSILASFKKYTYAPEPLYLEAIFNCFDSMKVAKELESNPNIHVVKYESILDDESGELNKLWSFLGLEEPEKVPKESWKDAYGKDWYANSSFSENKKETKFDKKRAKVGWKKNLEEWEINFCEYVCGDLMEMYGYELVTEKKMQPFEIILNSSHEINQHFLNWKKLGIGIQKFPTDPLKKENWAESVGTI